MREGEEEEATSKEAKGSQYNTHMHTRTHTRTHTRARTQTFGLLPNVVEEVGPNEARPVFICVCVLVTIIASPN